jgi:hypothetical protein
MKPPSRYVLSASGPSARAALEAAVLLGDQVRPVRPTPEAPRTWTILVVDDDADTREMLQRVLVSRGASVETASSAAEALASIESGSGVGVLVTDVAMPTMDGLELVRQVRQRGLGEAELPAIVLTAFVSAEDQQRAALAGAQAHLSKPVDFSALLREIARLTGSATGD